MSVLTTPAAAPVIRRAIATIEDLEVRASRDGEQKVHLVGHAAVFNRMSHDLGGFREKIAKGAFSRVLDANPDVHLVHSHDMSRVMARTRSKTLELSEDPRGLRVWARLDPEITYVADLVRAMERGDVDQMSFAFTVRSDVWEIEHEGEDERVVRTVTEVGDLFDVSVVAQGAYPQTDASLRGLLEAAVADGRLALPEIRRDADAAGESPAVEDETAAGASPAGQNARLRGLKARARALTLTTKEIR